MDKNELWQEPAALAQRVYEGVLAHLYRHLYVFFMYRRLGKIEYLFF